MPATRCWIDSYLRIPLPASVPEGYVYVPPGRFLYGSNDDELARRNLLGLQPLHEFRTGGYLIARHEMTHGEWLRYPLNPPRRVSALDKGHAQRSPRMWRP